MSNQLYHGLKDNSKVLAKNYAVRKVVCENVVRWETFILPCKHSKIDHCGNTTKMANRDRKLLEHTVYGQLCV